MFEYLVEFSALSVLSLPYHCFFLISSYLSQFHFPFFRRDISAKRDASFSFHIWQYSHYLLCSLLYIVILPSYTLMCLRSHPGDENSCLETFVYNKSSILVSISPMGPLTLNCLNPRCQKSGPWAKWDLWSNFTQPAGSVI